MDKQICSCGRVAVWVYLPGHCDGVDYFCDECVSRECTCNHRFITSFEEDTEYFDYPEDENFRWIKEGEIWVSLDDKGREWPCCEYMYNEEGFDVEDTKRDILMYDYLKSKE